MSIDSDIIANRARAEAAALQAEAAAQSASAGTMTNAQVKTAYESNANTNAFTDSEKTKLASIQAGTGGGSMTDEEVKTAYENNVNTNAFTDSEKSKLASIQAGTGGQTLIERLNGSRLGYGYGTLESAAVNGAFSKIPFKNVKTVGALEFNSSTNRFKLKKGYLYKIFLVVKINFDATTSWASLELFDATHNDNIDFNYPYGVGCRSLSLASGFSGNNSYNPELQALIAPLVDTEIELRIHSQVGSITQFTDYNSVLTIEEYQTNNIDEVHLPISTPNNFHIQGAVYHPDYPNHVFVSYAESIEKINLSTGLSEAVYTTFNDHVGGLAYHPPTGKLYVPQTNIGSFNNSPTNSKIYEFDPVNLTLDREINLVTTHGLGCLGSDGTKLWAGYGSANISEAIITEVDVSTLQLTGSPITIQAQQGEFGYGVQCMNFYNNKWYIGVHLRADDDSGWVGGGQVQCSADFSTVYRIILREFSDFTAGYGNGFYVVNNSFGYWIKPTLTAGGTYTHEIMVFKDSL